MVNKQKAVENAEKMVCQRLFGRGDDCFTRLKGSNTVKKYKPVPLFSKKEGSNPVDGRKTMWYGVRNQLKETDIFMDIITDKTDVLVLPLRKDTLNNISLEDRYDNTLENSTKARMEENFFSMSLNPIALQKPSDEPKKYDIYEVYEDSMGKKATWRGKETKQFQEWKNRNPISKLSPTERIAKKFEDEHEGKHATWRGKETKQFEKWKKKNEIYQIQDISKFGRFDESDNQCKIGKAKYKVPKNARSCRNVNVEDMVVPVTTEIAERDEIELLDTGMVIQFDISACQTLDEAKYCETEKLEIL